jgi:Tfp pilus assembly protein PilE
MKFKKNNSYGFTFVQILAVVVLLAVIASIVAVSVNNQTKRTELSSNVTKATLLYDVVSKYTIDNGTTPTKINNADYIAKPALIDVQKVVPNETKNYTGNYFIYGTKNKVSYDYPPEYIGTTYNKYKSDKGINPMVGSTSYIDVNKLYTDGYLDYKPQTAYVLISTGNVVQDINNNGTVGAATATTLPDVNGGDKPSLPIIMPDKASPYFADQTLSFTATSYYSKDNNMTYTWGGGYHANGIYAAGNYAITVFATASDAKISDTATFNLVVGAKNGKPTLPVITSNPANLSNITSNDIVTFTAVSTDPENDPITYKWIGTTSSNKYPRGDNTVSVYAVDSNGNFSDKASITFTVKNAKPVITGVTKNPLHAYQNDVVDVLPVITDSDGDAFTFTITGANENRIYLRGTHPLTFIATDSFGASSDPYVYNLIIENKAPSQPVVTVSPNINDLRSYNLLTFTINSVDIEGDPITYWWQMDNGAWSTTQPSNYYKVGNHTLNTKAIDSYGASSTINTMILTINNTMPNPPTLITMSPTITPYADTAITWAVSGATDLDGQAPSPDNDFIVGYEWLNKSTYYQKGNYTIQARAVDNHGGRSAYFSYNFTVINKPPTTPVITMTPLATSDLRTNTPITFIAKSTDVDITDSISYEWINQKTYYGKGLNTVQARAKDSDGAYSAYQTISFTVNNTRPTNPWITMSPLSSTVIKATTPITFTAGGSQDVDGDPITYQYNRDNAGWTTTVPNGTYIRGNHTIQVRTIDNDNGISDAVPISFTVVNSDPIMTSLTMSPSAPLYANTPITFYTSATDADNDTLTYDFINKQSLYARGNYTVQARALDSYGGVSPYIPISFTILNSTPSVPIAYVTLSGNCSNCVQSFSHSTSNDVDGDFLSYEWQVDGGAFSSTVPNTSYSLAQHTVGVRAKDTFGGISGTGVVNFTWRFPYTQTEVDVPGHYISVVNVPGHSASVVDVPAHNISVMTSPGGYVSVQTGSIPYCNGGHDLNKPPNYYGGHPGTCQYAFNNQGSIPVYSQVYVPPTYGTQSVPATYKTIWVDTTYSSQWVSPTYKQVPYPGYWYQN